MTNKLIIANFKMNMTQKEVMEYINKYNELNKFEMIVCPTSIYAEYFIKNKMKTGIQNIYFNDSGSYTGETSASQASSIGIEYVLIGHSERRKYFNENNNLINQKIKSALANNLTVILCIGENKGEDLELVLNEQLYGALEEIKDINNIVIAYEPVWAIGTGLIPTMEQIENTINYIKQIIMKKFNHDIKVLYGGSVSSKNIEDLNTIKNVDGFLIGGASLNIEEMFKIYNSCK